MSTTPTLPTFFMADPSVWTVHVSIGSSFSLQGLVNYAIKYASTWALIATRGRYSMSNWPNSNCPLDESSHYFYLVHCLSYWLVCHDDDGVCLEVVTKFPRSDQQCESYLFHPWVICLCSLECLAGIIDWLLDIFFFSNQCQTYYDVRHC